MGTLWVAFFLPVVVRARQAAVGADAGAVSAWPPRLEADLAAQLIERLLADPAFRARFRRDPAGACREAGPGRASPRRCRVGGGKAMTTLDMRESKSSLAGVMMAAAMEGVAIYQFTENILPHLEEIPGQIADVLSRVDLPAMPDVLEKPLPERRRMLGAGAAGRGRRGRGRPARTRPRGGAAPRLRRPRQPPAAADAGRRHEAATRRRRGQGGGRGEGRRRRRAKDAAGGEAGADRGQEAADEDRRGGLARGRAEGPRTPRAPLDERQTGCRVLRPAEGRPTPRPACPEARRGHAHPAP